MHKLRIFISDVHMSTNDLGRYKHNFIGCQIGRAAT
jgi:hypothetical protein